MVAHLTGNATWATSLHYRDFRLLWGSTILYALGSGMEHVALGWLVFEMTGSPFMVGVAAAAQMAPFFFLGILSGVVADRVGRRLLMRLITLAASLIAALMAILLLAGVAHVWALIGLVTAGGCILGFDLTVRQAYTYDIVGPGNALNGLALTSMGMQAGGIAGAIASGALIGALGAGWQYVGVSLCYLVSIPLLLAMRTESRAVLVQIESVWGNLAGYLLLVRQNRILLVLMGLASVTEVLGFTHMTLLPVFAKDVLHVGPLGLGFMTAVRRGGGLVGLWLLANLRDYRHKGLMMFVIAGAFGLGMMAFSLSTNLYFFLAVLVVVNACAMAVDTLYKTLMQANVPDEQRGRAMGAWVLSIGVAPVGHLGVGGLAGLFGAPGALLINGAALAFISLAAAMGLPRMRRMP